MKNRITAVIFLAALAAANVRADGFAPWAVGMPGMAAGVPPRAAVPATGFAPWMSVSRIEPRPATGAGDEMRIGFHGFGPWVKSGA